MKSVDEYIAELYPEAAGSPLLEDMRLIAIDLFGSKLRPSMYNFGIALGILHLLEPFLQSDQETGSGSIIVGGQEIPISGGLASLKEGDLSISFSSSGGAAGYTAMSGKNSLMTTKWGQQLWQLINSNALYMGLVGGV